VPKFIAIPFFLSRLAVSVPFSAPPAVCNKARAHAIEKKENREKRAAKQTSSGRS
jgi:hypothetical protein